MDIGISIYNKALDYFRENARAYIIESNMSDEDKVRILSKIEEDIPDDVIKKYINYKCNICKFNEIANPQKELGVNRSGEADNYMGSVDNDTFYSSLEYFKDPGKWHGRYITVSSAVISSIIGAYSRWRAFFLRSCLSTNGQSKLRCRIEAISKAINMLGSSGKSCDKSTDPEQCRKELVKFSTLWNKRKTELETKLKGEL